MQTSLKKTIDEIALKKIAKNISFHILGEPLLYPKLNEAIKYVKEKGLIAEITSNGSLLTKNKLETLIKLNLDEIVLSIPIDINDSRTKNKTFNSENSYQKWIEIAKTISKAEKTKLKFRVMNYFTKRLFGVKDSLPIWTTQKNFRNKFTRLITDFSSGLGIKASDIDITKKINKLDTNNLLEIWINDYVGIEIRIFADWYNAFSRDKVPAKFGFCDIAFNNIGILSNGEVTICCVDFDGKTSLGNVNSNSLYSLIKSPKSLQIADGFRRKRLIHPACQICIGGKNNFESFYRSIATLLIYKIYLPNNIKKIHLFQ
ncbi:MAG: SPASM domain-containing protein [archaeon]